MARLPAPPPLSTIHGSRPAWAELPTDTLLWRIFARAGSHPAAWNTFRTWGPGPARFDPHVLDARGMPCTQARGVMYAAADIPTCFAEVFQETSVIERARDHRTLAGFRLTRPLRLLNLWDAWATRLSASGALSTGPHSVTCAWSQALYEAFPDADGIRYESSMHPARAAFALYDRAADALPAAPHLHRELVDPELFRVIQNAARRFGYAVE